MTEKTGKNGKTSSERSAISKRNNRKGKDFERETARALRDIFPNAERQLEFQASQANGVDIRGTDPYRIQCKNYAKYASLSKIEEVQFESGTIPVLVTKGKGLKPIAAVYFSDFVKMLRQIYGVAERNEKNNVDDLI